MKKGAPIACPKCLKAALKLSRDVYEGETIQDNQIEIIVQYGLGGLLKIQHQAPKNGDPIRCLCYGVKYCTIGRINQNKGILK